MRKLTVLFLCLTLLLCGCTFYGERLKEPVNFYYPRGEFEYHQEDSVIGWETREASGHRDNLSYLLALYRMGPSSEDLRLPFPDGTAIIMMGQSETDIHIGLGSAAASMSDSDFALACACLTMTCTELTDVKMVTVSNGQRSITMSRDSITLLDNSMIDTTEETQ